MSNPASPNLTIDQAMRIALTHHREGRLPEAEGIYRQILAQEPNHAPALQFLGVIAYQTAHHDQALQLIRRAMSLQPEQASYHSNLGMVLAAKGELVDAIAAFSAAIRLNPALADAHYNLGKVLGQRGNVDAAIAAYHEALRLRPQFPDALCNLGNVLKDCGQLDQAIGRYREAMSLQPQEVVYHDNLLYSLHFHPECDSWKIREEHLRWEERHATPLEKLIRPHDNDRSPDRKLRIGYVSAHFRDHSECFFVLPLLEAHDRAHIEVHCYASLVWADEVTARFKRSADAWHDVRGLSDAALAEQIRADQIDILIDLTMHMSDSRLLCFARKPAPVQVSWLAYPGSTGMSTIDYRLSDRFLDPPDEDASWSFEQIIRLPDCWCCYNPVGGGPDVTELPAARAAHVTFGALNNPCKVNERVLDLWAQVLNAVNGSSRLLMFHTSAAGRQRAASFLESRGVAPHRLEFVSWMPRPQYLRLYERMDIALDTFPYNGITTTCDALWMGVPVVTLTGNVPASRASRGLLNMVALDELANASPEQFVTTATDLANDRPRLTELRRTLRDRMRASPLMNARRFARNVENAYRDMWRRWCQRA